jgi:hypothetical protein
MSISIRNDKYDLYVEQAYLYYDIPNTSQNYVKAVDYALRLSMINSFNRLFLITFYNPSDIVLIEDVSLMAIQSFQYIISRISGDAGSNIDEYTSYGKYSDNMQDLEYMLNNARKLVYENFLVNKVKKFRLSRSLDFHINISN